MLPRRKLSSRSLIVGALQHVLNIVELIGKRYVASAMPRQEVSDSRKLDSVVAITPVYTLVVRKCFEPTEHIEMFEWYANTERSAKRRFAGIANALFLRRD